MDGATELQVFFRIILPLLAPTVAVVATTIVITALKTFDIVYVMTNGQYRTEVIGTAWYHARFTNHDAGTAGAIAIILLLAIIPVMLINIRRFQAQRLKSRYGSAVASPSDYKDMVPVNGPGDDGTGPAARGADDKNRVPRAELISIITEQLSRLTDDIGRALKGMGFSGAKGGQVVVTGGGAELAGIAEFLQSALGRPVRIGKPPAALSRFMK